VREAGIRRDEEVERLGRLDSCVVSDALDALGLDGVLTGIAPRWEGARAFGRAVTMELAEGPAPADLPKVHLGVRAISRCGPGDVIVIGNGGRIGMGSWGGLLSVGALAQGVGGVVTDGACRDVDEARDLHFPVFARGATARTARGRVHEVSCGEEILIGSVMVRTGDLVLADGSAAVVIAAGTADEVLTKAEEIMAKETAMVDEIRTGASLATVLGVRYEDMLSGTGEKRA